MTDEDELVLWLGSFRYYCGRMTIAVGAFCELLRSRWPFLPQRVRDLIQRDLEEEYTRDNAYREQAAGNGTKQVYLPLGMDCDRAEWDKVRAMWKKP
jgi:hypothetical protein